MDQLEARDYKQVRPHRELSDPRCLVRFSDDTWREMQGLWAQQEAAAVFTGSRCTMTVLHFAFSERLPLPSTPAPASVSGAEHRRWACAGMGVIWAVLQPQLSST
ncbi:unnamed protein product [Pleuronectes platessa]|uniref:Uncharacterized protein n=1 Tax=Pleuronectes platessa TaxID=8262 RepID=A0A9N7VZM4_PLEPL|nr:unnamed protein product [Pleuronectes platessa]